MGRHSEAPSSGADPTPSEVARRLVMGFRTTQLLHAAAKLDIADRLKNGPRDIATLAIQTGAHPQALSRLLRALASLGFFAARTDGRFELTPLAQTLRSDAPGSVRDLALLYGDEWVWDAYGGMLYSVMTGLPAFDFVHGQSLFHYMRAHPQAAAVFDQGMTAYSEQEATAILAAYDFAEIRKLIDVGGGQGALLIALLRAYPKAQAVLFEQSDVIDRARRALEQAGVASRCALESGSFFEALPAGGDACVLKSILHNWDDVRSKTILEKCRDAMAPAARLLIIERVVPEGNESSEAKLFDINMLVILGGLERTEAEYRDLLDATGFNFSRVIPTGCPLSIIEAVPR